MYVGSSLRIEYLVYIWGPIDLFYFFLLVFINITQLHFVRARTHVHARLRCSSPWFKYTRHLKVHVSKYNIREYVIRTKKCKTCVKHV